MINIIAVVSKKIEMDFYIRHQYHRTQQQPNVAIYYQDEQEEDPYSHRR
jgi:hypothetical protein